MNIFVGSLPFKIEEAELKEHFEAYGEVGSVKIISDKFSGRSKGFGFVEMPDDEAAKKAIDALNGSDVGGRAIVVNQAEERKEGERRPSFRDGGGNRGGSGGSGGFRGGNRSGGGNSGGGGGGYSRERGEKKW